MADSYELFDHTADLGIRARAATLPGLVVQATMALYAAIGEIVAETEIENRTLTFEGRGPAVLLREFLAKLLVIFETQECVAHRISIEEFSDGRLEVVVRLAEVDPQSTIYHREVKAVTYHELAIRHDGESYEATIILDI